MTLGELIQEYRKEHNISQRQFAAACDLSNGYISMLERGENPKTKLPLTPTLPAMRKLAQGMGLTLTDLFLRVDDMPVDLMFDGKESKEISADPLIGHEKEPTVKDDGLSEVERIFLSLPQARREEVLRFMEYQLSQADGE